MNQVKIEKGMTIAVKGRFPCRLWRIDKTDQYLDAKAHFRTSSDGTFTIDHICGPYLGLRSHGVRCMIDVRKVKFEVVQ